MGYRYWWWVVLLAGCDIHEGAPVVKQDKIYIPSRFGSFDINVVEYDNCEYVVIVTEGTMMTHKGNCKYCQERNKKE